MTIKPEISHHDNTADKKWGWELFSGTKSTLVGIPLTKALGENRQFSLQIMFIHVILTQR